ncbi:MAG: SUMF1/EgtB/PvdO family nonheme iron enzyme [Planctomycetes bacterium]|nr:SUMF1/EgtB/PvdO family nonheme iron enzyme [Planctomycetota bacterium]
MINRVLFIAFVCLQAGSAFAAESRRWALLIGVNEYSALSGLTYAGKDMQALAEQLQSSGFDSSRVVLIHDQATDVKYRPLRANIKRELELILRRVNKDDLVLIAFSGHGLFLDGKSYFCPTEASDGDPESTLISVDSVYKQLESCPAALKIMLVDACRNDPRPPGKKSANPKQDLEALGASFERPPEGLVIFNSCGPGQISWEDEKLGHGVFMNYFLQGLSGEADANKNGKISLEELFEYSSDKTESFVATRRSDFQRPSRKGEIHGKFEFLPSRALTPPIFNFADTDQSQSKALAAQQAWADYLRQEVTITNTLGMQFRLLPPGEFLMGSTESKEDLESMGISTYDGFENNDEHPQHRVQITRPMYVGTYEVTLGQFLKYYNSDKEKHKTDAEKDGKGGWGYDGEKFEQKPSYVAWNTGFNQPVKDYMDHPVVNVSWNDAVSFCKWLTQKERSSGQIRVDQEYRLLDEAQWEYAARGGSRGLFGFGNNSNELTRYGNVKDSKFSEKFNDKFGDPLSGSDGHIFTAPVGKYKSNGFGLYDMHGNVWEWCQDGYDANAYSSRRGTVKDPYVKEGSGRVYRGGGWVIAAVGCRSADRNGGTPGIRGSNLGFRVSLQSVR